MAALLQKLDISIPALEHILRYDIFPLLYPNLLTFMGYGLGLIKNGF